MLYKRSELDKEILLAKAKLLSREQEQEILLQIQSGIFHALETLTNSYAYSILKMVKQKALDIDNYQDCIQFCCKELQRLAMLEKDNLDLEKFTMFTPWWIMGALEDYSKLQKDQKENIYPQTPPFELYQ